MFDDIIKSLKKWFEQQKDRADFRKIQLAPGANPPSVFQEDSPSSIILKEDTHVELGHPSAGSCSLCAATEDASLVSNGTVTFLGPDVAESESRVLPFAQLVFASCEASAGEASLTLDRIVHSAGKMKGYMLRSVPNRVWARVSKEAAASGFSFETLAQRLYHSIMTQCPEMTGAEIFFVTTSKDDVSDLERLVQPARETLEKIQTYERLPDGTYECTTGLDCTECPEKPVCDNIREVITIRKGDRIITFDRNKDRLLESS